MVNIYLSGFQGVGKTTYGKKAAAVMKWPFFDSDEMILQKYPAASVRALCTVIGEGQFRLIEEEVIAEISNPKKAIIDNALISLGGGSFEKESNRCLLASSGTIIYLYKPLEHLFEELKKRPLPIYLASYEDFIPLFRRRHAHFSALAAEIISLEEVTEEHILNRIASYAQQ
ncbi:MAG TPA: shikimate kinase [Chlamydiales bacterium]|nr:shikimate kinase [Chlamydiales bacterium]